MPGEHIFPQKYIFLNDVKQSKVFIYLMTLKPSDSDFFHLETIWKKHLAFQGSSLWQS